MGKTIKESFRHLQIQSKYGQTNLRRPSQRKQAVKVNYKEADFKK